MKQTAPAAARNRDPIADVLAQELPGTGLILEVASGTGEHVVHFAARFPALTWQPTDPDEGALASISAWREEAGLPNIRPPMMLDAAAQQWPVAHAEAMVCVNMIHISPPASGEGLLAGAGRLLPASAPLILYGPYIEDGVETAPSNLEFDASLKARNPAWGLRTVAWVDALARGNGLSRTRRVAMPANNIMLVYRKD